MSKIIHYSPEYYEALKAYYRKTWPERADEYFDYRIKEIPECETDASENLVLLNDEEEVIGCNFFFPTHALIHGVDTKIFWRHDTMLDEKYRGDLGVDLMLANRGANKFAAGLSPVNYKIQKKMKTPFIGTEHFYFMLNLLSPFTFVTSFANRGRVMKFREYDKLKVSGYEFKYISDVSQLNIPNNGYWFNVESDVEFIRDAHFIDKRFLHNFNKYYMYAHEDNEGRTDLYFVLRVTYGKGLPALSIIDFRYDMNNKQALKVILKAANLLAIKNKIPITRLTTTMVLDKSLYTFKRKDNPYLVVLGPNKLKCSDTSSIVFTMADSDADFLVI